MNNKDKLVRLAQIEGFDDTLEMLEEAACDGACPAICTNEGCEYTTEMEPDQDRGWCEECGTNTVKSCLVLGGFI